MIRILSVIIVSLAICLPSPSQVKEILLLVVASGHFQRTDTPGRYSYEGINVNDTSSFRLFQNTGGKITEKVFQIEQGYNVTLWWIQDGITTPGETRSDPDGTQARRADRNGIFKNCEQAGIVFFSHPSEKENHEPMRIWPGNSNDYRGDVHFEFCPARDKEWILNQDNIYRLKYRILICDGKVARSIAESIRNDSASPPEVKLYNNKTT